MPTLTHRPSHSMQILQLDYDPATAELQVTFTSTPKLRYVYAPVPASVYADMTTAPSAGVYFHRVIKRHYQLLRKTSKGRVLVQ